MSIVADVQHTRMFPDDLGYSLRRAMTRFSGAMLTMTAVMCWLSLATWSNQDPSLSNATDVAAGNLLGYPGAVVADMLFQTLGLAAIVALLPLAAWGWHLLTLITPNRAFERLLLWPLGLGLFAAALSGLPVASGWPLQVDLGGLAGDHVLRSVVALGSFLELPVSVSKIIASLALPVISFWALSAACGIRMGNYKVLLKRAPARPKPHYDDEVIEYIAEPVAGDNIFEQLETRVPVVGQVDHMGRIEPLVMHPGVAQAGVQQVAPVQQAAPVQQTAAPAAAAMPQMQQQPAPFHTTTHIVLPQNVQQVVETLHQPTGVAAAPVQPAPVQQVQMQPAPVQQIQMQPAPAQPAPANSVGASRSNGAPAAAQPLGVPVTPTFIEAPQDDAPMSEMQPGDAPQVEAQPMHTRVLPGEQLSLLGETEDTFRLPPLEFLKPAPAGQVGHILSDEEIQKRSDLLEQVLEDFKVKGEVIDVKPGPVVTLYEFEPARGVKSAQVINLSDDIARIMGAVSARVAVIPGRNAIGVELPNEKREMVYLREQLEEIQQQEKKVKLPMVLGKNIGGESVSVDLGKMPHVLIAGTTGSGKSVGINTMIISLLYNLRPDQCKFIMIDPKMLELSVYDGIPHLLSPVVTDPKKAVTALNWVVREMEERYKKMAMLNVRNIGGYNSRIKEANARGEMITRKVQTGVDANTGRPTYAQEQLDFAELPYIVVVIDEMADLMMVAGKEIEGSVQRIAQKARAAGIHLITATQRPSVDVITGTIKANFPTRISFQVTSKIDSRTILGEMGAEQLLGAGDMLHMAGGGQISRVHGSFISDEEVERIANYLKAQGAPQYLKDITVDPEEEAEKEAKKAKSNARSKAQEKFESLYDEAVAVVIRDRKASTSYIQRRLSIGYNKAATLIERMQDEGVISAANHAGKREILVEENQPQPESDDATEGAEA